MTQKDALDILKQGHNVYLTGAAGSGKTYVLNAYIKYLKENGIEAGVTASTGIAATHMGGVTIHSWTGLGIRDRLTDYDIDDLEAKQYLWQRFEKTSVLIIDEVSMLHHFRLDLVDKICRAFKRNNDPFGGMQVVLCGDFFQLPPVSRQGEPEAHFIYKADAWRDGRFKICYLEEQFRQTDDAALEILNAIRRNDITDDVYDHLRSRYNAVLAKGIVPTKLYTHNMDVDRINDIELSKIAGEEHVYTMTSRGRPQLVEALKKSCLAPERLALRVGTRVMFVKNNFEAGYANGTLGVVTGFDESDTPLVKTVKGDSIAAEPMSWGVEEEGKIKAELTQVPLRLAWAITVHKSQGMSLDAIEVDLSRSFVAGMGYVALSRVRTLAGLRLLGLNEQALQINEEVLEFDRELLESSKAAKDALEEISPADLRSLHSEFIIASGGTPGKPKEAKVKIPTLDITRNLVMQKVSINDMAEIRKISTDTIIKHLSELVEADRSLDIGYLRPAEVLIARVDKASKKAADTKLSSIKNVLGSGVSYTELKVALLFLR